jgi:hypothetical protein
MPLLERLEELRPCLVRAALSHPPTGLYTTTSYLAA